mmetsp:Transcript_40201/g.127856  ORF Transcript_40201/g.127856 Transcript_40201/m.127856 type:complete len:167 (+) Transcript_40201:94-594(+)
MSSWQQAVSADLYKGKKRVVTVAMSGNQQKNLRTGRDDPDMNSWICSCCRSELPGPYNRCDRCGTLRPDERANRMEMRAKDGEIGRGGGFFQRSSTDDHREWNSDNEEYDEFGRKKRSDAAASSRTGPSVQASAGKAPMTERQKAALARLRQRAQRNQRAQSPAAR